MYCLYNRARLTQTLDSSVIPLVGPISRPPWILNPNQDFGYLGHFLCGTNLLCPCGSKLR